MFLQNLLYFKNKIFIKIQYWILKQNIYYKHLILDFEIEIFIKIQY